MKTIRHPALLPLFLILALAAACSGPAAGRAASEAADPSAKRASAVDEGVAPEFSLTSLDGSTVRFSDSNGRVRLIDFWATWCAPCREEIPMLNALHATYAEQGLEILAIADSDESAEVVQEFAQEHGVIYTNLLGSMDVSAQYRVLGLPTAYLVDREGKIVETFFGPKPKKNLENKIRELLELPPLT